MKIFIAVFWFFIFIKLLFFWVWLWQLKEYRLGRFRAHFGTQKIKKIIFSLHGIRYPKLTQKTFIILVSGILIGFLILFELFSLPSQVLFSKIWDGKPEYLFYLLLLILIILAPIIFSLLVLFFQIPASILIKRILKKAKEKREEFKELLVIGITGSYGKTSTKEFLATILEEKFKILKTPEHQNTDPGIARCVLDNLTSEHQIFIVEMAAYKLGEIKPPCRMVQPKIGILTGINEQHLATFGSRENIIDTKFELIESLPENGIAIFNGNNKYCFELYKKAKTTRKPDNIFLTTTGKMLSTDIWAEDIKVEKEFISFKVNSEGGDSANFRVNLLGRQNIENILLAVCCAKELGMRLEEIAAACRKIRPKQGTAQLKKSKQNLNIIDATYSANPDGVIADLEHLKNWEGKKAIVMPCLIELGKAGPEIHKKIGKKIGQVCDLALITTRDYFQEIKKGAIETGLKGKNILFIKNPKEIIEKLNIFGGENDIVLLESRVPKQLIK